MHDRSLQQNLENFLFLIVLLDFLIQILFQALAIFLLILEKLLQGRIFLFDFFLKFRLALLSFCKTLSIAS